MAKKKQNSTKKNTLKTKSKAVPKSKKKIQIQWFKNEKLRIALGLVFILLGIFLFISFTSYIFTWKFDQDKIHDKSFFSFVFSGSEVDVKNALGKLGAYTGNRLMYHGFGLASYIFSFFLIILGVRLAFKYKTYSLKKSTKIGIITLLWLPFFLAVMSSKPLPYLGGVYGYEIKHWLESVIGKIGTVIFMLFTLVIILVTFTKITLDKIPAFINRFISNLNKNDEDNSSGDEVIQNTAVKDIHIDNNITEDKIIEEKPTPTVEFETENEVSKKEDATLSLEIEDVVENNAQEQEEGEEFTIVEQQKDETLSKSEINDKVKEFGEYDPTLDLATYQLPSIDLLNEYDKGNISINKTELEENKNKIVETLANYKIEISKIKATIGPTVTLYEIVPAPGVRISKIKNLEDDIALSLAALGIRIIAPIPGKGTIGIEVPNSNPNTVAMRTLISSDKFQNSDMALPVALGKTISNETFIADLAKMPHLLMAGATGQGKSVGLNAMLVSILYKKHPAQVKFVLVDPKKVELTLFNRIERHFLAKLPDTDEPIITDTSKVVATVNSLCIEMDTRYELLKEAQCRNIKEYNKKFISRRLNPEKGHRYLPYIVLVVDEFADLIMTAGKEVEMPIARLAQLARAIGIHLIIATQRPSVNIITGTIKANFPSRIAFRVTSKIDSRTILDTGGADQLIGRGDMLFSNGNDIIRLQCGFVDTPEVELITDFIGQQRAYPDALLLPEYVGESSSGATEMDEDLDPLFEEAAKIIVTHQQGSASLLQRKLKLGYNRAGRIVDQLESAGIIGPHEGSKARKVLISDEISLEQFLSNL